jgi:hypothetical protein
LAAEASTAVSLRSLEVEHRLVERLAALGELHRFVEGALGRGLRLDGDRQPSCRSWLIR